MAAIFILTVNFGKTNRIDRSSKSGNALPPAC
nr:MAG TPA: hypothetical protein [Caudoviricetes sp.]